MNINKLIKLTLLFVLLYVTFPAYFEPVLTGLDPSWRLFLNMIGYQSGSFGTDYFFTYGPLGYLLYPKRIGYLWDYSIFFWLGLHFATLLLLSYVFFYEKKLSKDSRTINLMVSTFFMVFAVYFFRTRFCEYYFSYIQLIILMLCTISSRYNLWLSLSCIISVLSCFIKFTTFTSSMLGTLVILIYLIYKKKNIIKPTLIIASVPLWIWLGFYIYNPDDGAFFDYIYYAKEISSGFISAMTIDVAKYSVIWGIGAAILVFLCGYFSYRNKDLSRWLIFSGFIFVSYRHGMVRGDHIHWFVAAVFMCLSLYVMFMDYTLKFANCKDHIKVTVGSCVGIMLMLIYPWMTIQTATPSAVLSSQYSRWKTVGDYLSQKDNDNFHDSRNKKLPQSFLNIIRDGEFTVYPWEISYGYGYSNFIIMPIPQQYQAYTSKLDELNANFLRNSSVNYIVFSLDEIDNRYPLLDAPQTWDVILSNYKIVDCDDNLFLLQKEKDILSRYNTFQEMICKNNDLIEIPDIGDKVYVSIQSELNIKGKVSKIIFKIPEVYLEMHFDDGTMSRRRVLMECINSPVLIDNVVLDNDDFYNVMDNKQIKKVTDIRLTGRGISYYKEYISVSFMRKE